MTLTLQQLLEDMHHATPVRRTRPGLARLVTSAYVERGAAYVLNAWIAPWPFEVTPPIVVLHPLDRRALVDAIHDPTLQDIDQAIADEVMEYIAEKAVIDGAFVKWPDDWKAAIVKGRDYLGGCQT